MDWEYIGSLSFENLVEDEKDELYNLITWYDSESENLSRSKCTTLIRLSQEVLKYKGEQVEVLLHKLDELAIQQGEEEAKRFESDTDGKSSKSKKSSSIELENIEQKYLILKGKYKKQIKANEKSLAEITKLNNKLKTLEQEKAHLLNEIQTITQGDDQSDVSETVKEQNKELIESLHNKNKQISNLLSDIEQIEKENSVLRDKLTNVRDELSVATKEIMELTERLKASKIEMKELSESLATLQAQNEAFQDDIKETLEQKTYVEKQMQEFSEEVNMRVEEWKTILENKEKQIEQLKLCQIQTNQSSSTTTSSLIIDKQDNQVSIFNKVINERENQLTELKTQLQIATEEMEATTTKLQDLKTDKDNNLKTITNLNDTIRELTNRLKTNHEHCQELQENVAYAEKISEAKTRDLNKILGKLKDDGYVELSENLAKMQELKSKNRTQEKQIMDLVKSVNKLQDTCDEFEKENSILREKLGLNLDEEINGGISIKQKQQKREFRIMRNQIEQFEEEILKLKNENHKLNRKIASLSNQLLELGEKPLITVDVDEVSKEKLIDKSSKNEIKNLSEENEALRKGLHEILQNFNYKKESESKEVKLDTFEELLRALDVKHISGWYHPAMRLQAELHNLQGINAELREQLRIARLEIKSLTQVNGTNEKPITTTTTTVEESETIPLVFDIKLQDSQNISDIYNNLQILKTAIDTESNETKKLENNLELYEFKFNSINEQLVLLYDEYLNEKQSLTDELTKYKNRIEELEDINEINESKLNMLTSNVDDNKRKSLQLVNDNVILKRKCIYLEIETNRLENYLTELKSEQLKAKMVCIKKINDLFRKNKSLTNTIEILTNKLNISVDFHVFNELNLNLENMTIKYRDLLNCFNETKNNNEIELKLFEKSCKLLKDEKNELNNKLLELTEKLYLINNESNNDLELLTKKLSQLEINEISERQRANHINNLYELVKEQLQKSDERFLDYEKYNKEISHKNLLLQKQLKHFEDKLINNNYIEINIYQQLQINYNNLLKQNENLSIELNQIEEELKILRLTLNTNYTWNSCKEQELLNLKHEIIDLQAISDEKMQLAQISNDLINARLQETECKNKLNLLVYELEEKHKECEELKQQIEQIQLEDKEKDKQMTQKLSIMQTIIQNHKIQYLGCIPINLEEIFINNLKQLTYDKHESYKNLYKTQNDEIESFVLKEQYEKELENLKEKLKLSINNADDVKKIINWHHEKRMTQLNEIKYRRQSELKEKQLQHVFQKIKLQDQQIIKLEEEILQLHKNYNFLSFDNNNLLSSTIEDKQQISETTNLPTIIKLTKVKEIQTDEIINDKNVSDEDKVSSLRIELLNISNQIIIKDQLIDQLKSKIIELEMNISLFRKQIGDKQSQISFYEKHILELQSKKEEMFNTDCIVDNPTSNNDEIILLKDSIKSLQESLKLKEDSILKYQSLLKEDRDKHSMAAALMQEEMQLMQKCLAEEKEKCLELTTSLNDSHTNKAAIEQYFLQVHAIEDQAAELRTCVSSLESQLQASRDEAVRWRTLANDRLQSMQKLGKDLEEVHKNEILVYKNDSEKWGEEVVQLKQLISKYRGEVGHEFDCKKTVKEKDDKLEEFNEELGQSKDNITTTRRNVINETSKMSDLEAEFGQLQKDYKTLKKNYEQLLNCEKCSRDEIKDLRGKLLKKPISSARSDKSDKSIKEQLQKKITTLENEIVELKENLNRQIIINEQHRIKISDDFDRWNKQKYWQQTTEKLKIKLKEKEIDFEKIQQTCSGYRSLIERMEREKHNLETKIKTLKLNQKICDTNEYEMLKIENIKLLTDNEVLCSKLEMQQHHSGGLGAAMLQEKLEAQERKIAILELSTKGNVEIRTELEKYQNIVSQLQKNNLRLEAENLEMKMDLEKSNKEVPHLRQQIEYLENYMEVLKKENSLQENPQTEFSNAETKKLSELERTVFILKRVVEKLQAENKRLLNGGKRLCTTRMGSTDKLQTDFYRLKEQYLESLQKNSQLEKDLETANAKLKTYENKPVKDNGDCSKELIEFKEKLEQKSQLLDKVKILLHRAATKEKELLREIAMLKGENAVSEEELSK